MSGCLDPWWHDTTNCDTSCVESPHAATEIARRVAPGQPSETVECGTSEAARRANVERPLDPALDTTESRPAMSVPTDERDVVSQARLRLHALELLDAHRASSDRLQHARSHLIGLARHYGVTYREIGEALGISESAARAALSPGEVA